MSTVPMMSGTAMTWVTPAVNVGPSGGITMSGWGGSFPITPEDRAAQEERTRQFEAEGLKAYAATKHFTVRDLIAALERMAPDLPVVVSQIEVADCGCCEHECTDEAHGLSLTQGEFYVGQTRCVGPFVNIDVRSP